MLETLNAWLGKWEPTWLLLVLLSETFVGVLSVIVLIKEYFYDMEFNEAMKERRKRKRQKAAFTLPEEKLTTGEMQ